MKNNDAKKFELFKKILLSQNGISIQKLTTERNDPKSNFYRYIQQLNQDLLQVFPETPFSIEQKNTIFFITLPDNLNTAYVIDVLGYSYISASPEYLILLAATQKKYSSLESLAQSINLSPSYTYRSLKQLNTKLERFNLKFTFNNSSKRDNLLGTEENIRFFLFYIYWKSFRGLTWPFNKSPDYFKNLPIPINTTLAPSQLSRLRYFQNITYWRVLYLQKKVSLEAELISYLEILDAGNPTLFTIDFNGTLTADEVNSEQKYFAFLTRFFIADIDTKEIKRKTAQRFLDSKLPLTKSCQNLLSVLTSTYNLVITQENYLIFFYHIMSALLYIDYIGNDYKPFLERPEQLSFLDTDDHNFTKTERELTKLVHNFLEKDPYLKKDLATGFITHMVNLLYYVIDSSRKITPLIIFCQYSKNFYTVDEIQNSLLTIFGRSAIQFTNDIQQADVVISDAYEGNIPNQNFFYFAEPYNPDTWRLLSRFIQAKLHDATFSL
ncbi:helix-turn-helix domain-containing protein [Enterococcus crotali]|uniref:helix-turn-helix domain-containing protein n=1 Tax=Enterococcus crotali TaxID=1453587 RepID=UPI001EF9FB3A|nr:helix-turn-helix domain-containing protein [Enterococcus crotali]